jgi:moderate conductance mechanosensitive channel
MELATTQGPLAEWLAARTDNAVVLWAIDGLVEPLLTILLVLIAAGVGSRLAQRSILRIVERAKVVEPLAVPRLGRLTAELAPLEVDHEQHETMQRRSQRADALGTLAISAAKVVIWAMATMVALGTVGINLGPLIAGAGILGVAIGFGAQDLVKDLLRGVSMLLEDQYGVGDVIDVGDASGVVEEVTLRTTRLRDVNGVVWHIPNGAIARVGNMTQEWSRLLLDVDVAYETDVDRAIEALAELLERFAAVPENAEIMLAPPEIWGVNELADSSVVIRVVAKTVPGQQWAAARRLRLQLKREFDELGIEIPFPQRTVWHRGLPDAGTPDAPDAPDAPVVPGPDEA